MQFFASPFDIDRVVHGVDFGAIIDREDKVVVENADKGAAPYKYNANLKGVNPMRNSQIHFTVSNVAKHTFELLDFDSEGSYAELYRVGENGEADVLIAKQEKLAATGAQYFTIPSFTDDGEFFITGAYYLRVYIKSNSGHLDVYDSSRVVLDAQTADLVGNFGGLCFGARNVDAEQHKKAFADFAHNLTVDGDGGGVDSC